VQEFRDNLREAQQQVRDAMGTTALTEKTYFDRRVKRYSFAVGQKVWLYWPRPLVTETLKVDTAVDGPVDHQLFSFTDCG